MRAVTLFNTHFAIAWKTLWRDRNTLVLAIGLPLLLLPLSLMLFQQKDGDSGDFNLLKPETYHIGIAVSMPSTMTTSLFEALEAEDDCDPMLFNPDELELKSLLVSGVFDGLVTQDSNSQNLVFHYTSQELSSIQAVEKFQKYWDKYRLRMVAEKNDTQASFLDTKSYWALNFLGFRAEGESLFQAVPSLAFLMFFMTLVGTFGIQQFHMSRQCKAEVSLLLASPETRSYAYSRIVLCIVFSSLLALGIFAYFILCSKLFFPSQIYDSMFLIGGHGWAYEFLLVSSVLAGVLLTGYFILFAINFGKTVVGGQFLSVLAILVIIGLVAVGAIVENKAWMVWGWVPLVNLLHLYSSQAVYLDYSSFTLTSISLFSLMITIFLCYSMQKVMIKQITLTKELLIGSERAEQNFSQIAYLWLILWMGIGLVLPGNLGLSSSLVGQVILLQGSLIAITIFIGQYYKLSSEFMTPMKPWSFSLACGAIILGFGMQFVGMLLDQVSRWILPVPPGVEEQFSELILGNGYGFVTLFFLVAFIPAVVEELAFRGWLLSALKKQYTGAIVWIIGGVLFALAHFNLFRFLPIIIFGTILCWLCDYCGDIRYGMLAHLVHNGLSVGLALSEITFQSEFVVLGVLLLGSSWYWIYQKGAESKVELK